MSKRKPTPPPPTDLPSLDDLTQSLEMLAPAPPETNSPPSTKDQADTNDKSLASKLTSQQADKSTNKKAKQRGKGNNYRSNRESVTVYVDPDVLLRLEMAQTSIKRLTKKKGYATSKSTLAEAALIYMLDDLDARQDDSFLADFVRQFNNR